MSKRPTIIAVFGLIATCACPSDAGALVAFRSDLQPVVPTPGNTWYDATGEFWLNASSMDFNIRFGVESVIPTEARIDTPGSGFAFDLGTALIAIHSPGPWPDGYDGATLFSGSFDLPASMREALVDGQATLTLNGASQGDFTGPIRALLGDTDADGDIDDTDLATSFAHYTGPIGGAGGKALAQGDTDADGDVDDTDLGSSFVDYTGPREVASVPEPGGLAVLLLGGCSCLRRSRVVLGLG
ncbi:MAG: hypothetical protein ACE37H_10075 [Phycisphaeraceae bacterium]